MSRGYEKNSIPEKYSKEREEELFDYEGENTNAVEAETPRSEPAPDEIPIQYAASTSAYPNKSQISSSKIFWKAPNQNPNRGDNVRVNVDSYYDDGRRNTLSVDDFQSEAKSVLSDGENDARASRTYFGMYNRNSRRESTYMPYMEKPSQESYQNMSVVDTLEMHGILKKKGRHLVPNEDGPKSVIEAALLPHVTFEQLEIMNSAAAAQEDSAKGYDKFIESELKNEGIPLPLMIPKYPLDKAVPFLILLAVTFHSYGAPANRTEWNMNEVSRVLGIEASYSVMPTLVTVTFGRAEGMDAISRTIRVCQDYSQGGKLYKLESMIGAIIKGKIGLDEARQRLDFIIRRSLIYPRYVRMIAFSLCSTCACALFFRGSYYDVLLSTLMGLITGLCSWLSDHNMAFARISLLISALLSSIIAMIFATYIEKVCFNSIILSAVVWNMPGLSIFLAIRELSTDNTISGTVRLFASFISALKIGFGITIGSKCVFWVDQAIASRDCTNSIELWTRTPFVPILIISFNILMDLKAKLWIGQILVSFIAYFLNLVLSNILHLSSDFTAVLSAFGVALTGNILSKYTRVPGIMFIHTAILLLVPGSLAITTGTYFFAEDSWPGLKFSYDIIVVGFSVTVGTLIADFLILRDKSLIYHLY